MIKRIQHIAPVQLGAVLAVLYGMLSLIVVVPFFLIYTFLAPHNLTFTSGSGQIATTPVQSAFPFGLAFVIFIPFLYAAGGFIGGIIAAVVYNIVARFTGGIEFTLTDAPG